MSVRLLIALPVAAVVVAALFWAMSEVVPAARPEVAYTVQISKQKVWIKHHCRDCNGEPMPRAYRPDPHEHEKYLRLPAPPDVEPSQGESCADAARIVSGA